LLSSLAVPIAKLAKIKRYIKEIGSIKEAAMLLTGASSTAKINLQTSRLMQYKE